jgi:hypothetical protein
MIPAVHPIRVVVSIVVVAVAPCPGVVVVMTIIGPSP